MLMTSENPHGGDIYRSHAKLDFSANLNPLGTPDKVKKAMRDCVDTISYYPDPYANTLRDKIAEKEKVSKDYILCGNGAADLIYSFAAALRPKNVLIVAPTFCEYENSLKQCNAKITYAFLQREHGFRFTKDTIVLTDESYDTNTRHVSNDKQICNDNNNSYGNSISLHKYISTDDQESTNNLFLNKKHATTDKHFAYDVIYVCNPNNPTGGCIPSELIKELTEYCLKERTYLFVDECFLEWTKEPSLVTQVANNPYLFLLKAFTKSYGMAGLRLGYAISSNKSLLQRMCEVTQTWNISSVAQAAGIAALSCLDFLENAKKIVDEERQYITSVMKILEQRYHAFYYYESDCNFLLFQAPIGLAEKMLQRGICIRSCGNFHGLDETYYRIAIRTHDENEKMLQCLEECLSIQSENE